MEGKMCSPLRKKSKRSPAVQKVSAEARAKQFEDLCVDSDVLFYKYCSQRIDFVQVHTIKDHLKLKKHIARKEVKSGKEKQVTLTSMVKSKCLREEYILDFKGSCGDVLERRGYSSGGLAYWLWKKTNICDSTLCI